MARNAEEREQAIRNYGNTRRRLGRKEPAYATGTSRTGKRGILRSGKR